MTVEFPPPSDIASAGNAANPVDTANQAHPASATPEAEPTTTGTLFLMMFFLMLIGGFWGMMYWMLLHR